MTGIQPELWVDRAAAAVEFYEVAFGAGVVHRGPISEFCYLKALAINNTDISIRLTSFFTRGRIHPC